MRSISGKPKHTGVIAILFLGICAPQALCDELRREKLKTNSPALSYDIDANFTYIDLLKRPQTSASLPSKNSHLSIMRPRTIGLTQLRLALDWNLGSATSFGFVLRPDATSSNKPEVAGGDRREFDSRAGDVYRPAPTVQLLDAYEVRKMVGPGLSVGLGVYEEIVPKMSAYSPVMEFGLGVSFAQKFSAVKFTWNEFSHEQPTAEVGKGPSGLSTTFFLMHGNEDRAEDFADNERTYDKAPSAKDPYYGGATYIGWTPRGRTEYGLLLGLIDSSGLGGKRNENFAQFLLISDFSIGKRRSEVVFDARYSIEKWRVEEQTIAAIAQQSASLTIASKISANVTYFLGAHYGLSERHASSTEPNESKEITGSQIDTGFFGEVSDNIELTFMLNQEVRNTEDDTGEGTGAFEGTEENNATLKRFALEMNYTLDDSL